MSFKDTYKGLRLFTDEKKISDAIKQSKRFNQNAENASLAKKVQLLETTNQRTYLVATRKNIYKIIDDRRVDAVRIAWSRPKVDLAQNNKLIVHLESYKTRTDKLIIDSLPDKINLVTKKLFANIEITDALDELLSNS
ncbi:MAG: hypothetical protein ACI935_000090 [Moritella dasanensis]|jgi:hypothetical protein